MTQGGDGSHDHSGKTTRSPRSPRWNLDIIRPYKVRIDGVLFLRRWRISTPWLAVLLTRIYVSDPDRPPHNHSRRFRTWILRGGYTELVWPSPRWRSRAVAPGSPSYEVLVSGQVREHRRFSLMLLPQAWAHRITDVKPGTLTLVLAGRWHGDKRTGRDSWYFWTTSGPVDMKDYR